MQNNIKFERSRLQMTQQELADALGAGGKAFPRQTEALQKLLVDPKNDPLIFPLLTAKHGLMQLHGRNQQHIPRCQQITAVFDVILNISGQEEIHLIKVMVVQGDLLQIGILITKNLKSGVVHGLSDIKTLVLGCHNSPISPIFRTNKIKYSI